jgi:hypothetical protein
VKQTAKTQGTVDAQRATDILAGTRFLTDVEVEVVYGFSKKRCEVGGSSAADLYLKNRILRPLRYSRSGGLD